MNAKRIERLLLIAEMAKNETLTPSLVEYATIDACEIGAEALRFQQEREKGCEHCNDTRCTTCCHFGWSPEICKRCVNQDLYKPRPFCQFCGRKLEPKEADK
jgi:multimeric flavodoxin WrbA